MPVYWNFPQVLKKLCLKHAYLFGQIIYKNSQGAIVDLHLKSQGFSFTIWWYLLVARSPFEVWNIHKEKDMHENWNMLRNTPKIFSREGMFPCCNYSKLELKHIDVHQSMEACLIIRDVSNFSLSSSAFETGLFWSLKQVRHLCNTSIKKKHSLKEIWSKIAKAEPSETSFVLKNAIIKRK